MGTIRKITIGKDLLKWYYNMVGIDLTEELYNQLDFQNGRRNLDEFSPFYNIAIAENNYLFQGYERASYEVLPTEARDIDCEILSFLCKSFELTQQEAFSYTNTYRLIVSTCLNMNLSQETDEDQIDYVDHYSRINFILRILLPYLNQLSPVTVNDLGNMILLKKVSLIKSNRDINLLIKLFVLNGMQSDCELDDSIICEQLKKGDFTLLINRYKEMKETIDNTVEKRMTKEEILNRMMNNKYDDRRLSYAKCKILNREFKK